MPNPIETLFLNTEFSLACAGVDPDIKKMPQPSNKNAEEIIYDYLIQYIDIVSPYICAFKAQKAFFDIYSGGHDLLENVVKYIHKNQPQLPVVLDCKIGDIDNTMSAYIENILGKLNCDGLVVNPYMGDDVFTELSNYKDKIVCVLAKTSNESASIVQDQKLENGMPLWLYVLQLSLERWNTGGNIVPILSSSEDKKVLEQARNIIPQKTPILYAGVGAQGRDESDITLLLNDDKKGVFVNSSRGLMYPKLKEDQSLQEGIKEAVIKFKNLLEKQR